MDPFDKVDALYWYCSHYHGGQGDYLYQCLSQISLTFKPGLMHNGPSSEESEELYNDLSNDSLVNARWRVEKLMAELTGVI